MLIATSVLGHIEVKFKCSAGSLHSSTPPSKWPLPSTLFLPWPGPGLEPVGDRLGIRRCVCREHGLSRISVRRRRRGNAERVLDVSQIRLIKDWKWMRCLSSSREKINPGSLSLTSCLLITSDPSVLPACIRAHLRGKAAPSKSENGLKSLVLCEWVRTCQSAAHSLVKAGCNVAGRQ